MKTPTVLAVSISLALGALSLRAETLDTIAEYGNAATANATSGAGTARGFTNPSAGEYTITAGGTDIWGNSDNGTFIYDADLVQSGDFSAVVRSVSIAADASEVLAGEWGRTGVMARRDPTSAGSAAVAHVRKCGTDINGFTTMQWRDTQGGGTNRGGAEHGNPVDNTGGLFEGVRTTPIWLALHRIDGVWYSSWADDAAGAPGTWSDTRQHPTTPETAGDVFVGLAHQSHNINPEVNTALFENFEVTAPDASLGDFTSFPVVANTTLDVTGTEVRVTATATQKVDDGDTFSVNAPDVDWEVRFIANNPSIAPGVTAEIYFAGNGGSLANAEALIASRAPDAAPVIANMHWGGPDRAGFDYPPEFNETTGQFTGNQENFMVNHLGEIWIDADDERDPGMDGDINTVAFKDGVDDYTYLNIDGQAIVDDNVWTGADGSENNGSPIAQLDVSDPKFDDGEWVTYQYITWEGGGGDAGILYTDMYDGDDNFPMLPTDPADVGDLVQDANLRTTTPTEVLDSEDGFGQPDAQLLTTPVPAGTDEVHFYVNGELVETVLLDTDGDGMPNSYEDANDLNKNVNDSAEDEDGDDSSNLEEYTRGSDPNNPDTDGDGARDGAEDGGGVFVSLDMTGTDPLNEDTDSDGLKDGVENPLLAYDPNNANSQPGTDPNDLDSDDDTIPDGGEVVNGSDPTDPNSVPGLSPNAVLKEDWDGLNINSVWNLTNNGGAAANITNIGGANGNVLRITNLNGSNSNSIAWDFSSYAADEIVISFLVSMSTDVDNAAAGGCCGEAADGFGFGLFDTAVYGMTGGNNPAAGASNWEDPRTDVGFPNAIMIGFDVFDGGGPNGNNVRVTGLGGSSDLLGDFSAPFQLNNSLFHKVIARLVADGTGGSILSVQIIEDINGVATEHDVITDLTIPSIDPNTFEGRMIAGGRTGGAFVETLLDCVQIEAFAGEPLRMTNIIYDQANDEFTFSWTANEGKSYGLYFSETAADGWGSDLNDSILAAAPSDDPLVTFADGVLTYGPVANPIPNAPVLLFRAAQN